MSETKKTDAFLRRIIFLILKIIFRNTPSVLPLDKSKIKKILIFRYDVIGDMIVTLPSLTLLKKINPEFEIHILASPSNAFMVKEDKRVAKVFEFQKSFKSILKYMLLLRKEKYDLVLALVFFRTTFAGLLANLFGGKKASKVTIFHEKRHKLYSTLFNIQIKIDQLRNKKTMAEIQERILAEIFSYDYNPVDSSFDMVIPNLFLDKAVTKLPEAKTKIFLNISSKDFRKWSIEKNIELIDGILKNHPDFCFFVSALPQDYIEAQTISNSFEHNVYCLQATNNYWDVAAAMNYCDFVITPDTSIVHLAAALKKPITAFYSSLNTQYKDWDPFNIEFRKIISDEGEPCINIPASKVINAFEELICSIKM